MLVAGLIELIEPQVCVTTSRDPWSRLKQFAKEVKLLIPNSMRINHGNNRVDELMDSCQQAEFTDVVIVQRDENRGGEPDDLVICHLPMGPTAFFTLSNVVLQHGFDGGAALMLKAYPHLILNNFQTDLGKRVFQPRPDTRRVVTFSNNNDYISFRHHMNTMAAYDEVTLHEVGLRFEMKLYQISLGT